MGSHNFLDVQEVICFCSDRSSHAASVGRRWVLGIPPKSRDMLTSCVEFCLCTRAVRALTAGATSTLLFVRSKLGMAASSVTGLMISLSEKGLRENHLLKRSLWAVLAVPLTLVLVCPGAMRSPSDSHSRSVWSTLNSDSPCILAGTVHIRRRVKAQSQPVHMGDAILACVGRIQWETDDVVLHACDLMPSVTLLSPATGRGPPLGSFQNHATLRPPHFHPAVCLQSDLPPSPQPNGRSS
jgi:hypothetical protein